MRKANQFVIRTREIYRYIDEIDAYRVKISQFQQRES